MVKNVNALELLEAPLVVNEEGAELKTFHLKDGSVDGQGLAPEFAGGDWLKFLEAMYEVRPRSETFDGAD